MEPIFEQVKEKLINDILIQKLAINNSLEKFEIALKHRVEQTLIQVHVENDDRLERFKSSDSYASAVIDYVYR